MIPEDFGKIILQVKNYCNCEMNDDQLNAYRRAFQLKEYDQVREAIELTYIGGYLTIYIQKRNIPAPSVFEEFFRNINRREEIKPLEAGDWHKTPVGSLILAIISAGNEARKPYPRNPNVFALTIRELWGKTDFDGEKLKGIMWENVAESNQVVQNWMEGLISQVIAPEKIIDDVPF